MVKKEKAELEETKDQLVKSIASGKKKLEECEDEILRFVFILMHRVSSVFTLSFTENLPA